MHVAEEKYKLSFRKRKEFVKGVVNKFISEQNSSANAGAADADADGDAAGEPQGAEEGDEKMEEAAPDQDAAAPAAAEVRTALCWNMDGKEQATAFTHLLLQCKHRSRLACVSTSHFASDV